MGKQQKTFLLWFDRALSQDILRQTLMLGIILGGIFVISFLLLSISGNDWILYCNDNHISKWVFPLYLLIDSNAFSGFYTDEHVSKLTVFMACLVYIAGVIIFTGMLISVMTNIIERRVENYREGHIHYLLSGHYVIMGYDEMVPSFIKHIFHQDKKAYVLILTSTEATRVTEKLRKSFDEECMKRIIINYGHRTTTKAYKEIHLEAAEEIFVVGCHSLPAHDAINVECIDCIYEYLSSVRTKQYPKQITCVFKDLDTYAAFKTTEIFDKIRKLDIAFIPYNFFTSWAKQIFVKRYYWNKNVKVEYPSVYGNGITPEDPKFVHLVFVGTTNFAVAFAIEAAHVLHFPNYNHDKRLKTRITFIDLNADKEKDEFITRNRHFFEVQSYRYQDLSEQSKRTDVQIIAPSKFIDCGDFLDTEFEFIKGDIFSSNIQNEISKWASDKKGQYLSIFLAMENQHNNFVMGMNMPDDVYNYEIPLFIRQDRSDNFVTNLRFADSRILNYNTFVNGEVKSEKRMARYAHVYPFGMNESIYSPDYKSIRRAKLINYLYNTADYCSFSFISLKNLNQISPNEIIKTADDKWKELSVAIKWSNLYSSYAIRIKLASLRAMRGLGINDETKDLQPLTNDEIEELAKVEHNRWNVEKLLMGYRKSHADEDKYTVADKNKAKQLKENKKLYIHHDIRPFNDLDIIKELDREFSKYIPWILEMTECYQ